MTITQQFKAELSEIIDVNETEINEVLDLNVNGNWDSLAIMSTAALIDQEYNVIIGGEQLKNCKSLGDILRLIKNTKDPEC